MATRAQLRMALRDRLKDASGPPNEFLSAAVRAYGATFPKQGTAATAAWGILRSATDVQQGDEHE